MIQTNLHGLTEAGVSVWADQISREMLDSGQLTRLIRQDSVSGVTSNPSIFSGAIVGSDEYAAKLKSLKAEDLSTTAVVQSLMADDIRDACDRLSEVYELTSGDDGFVSVEVTPTLAFDVDETVAEAHSWRERIDRPNLLVKVPATVPGVESIRQLTAAGVSVNVTLIFSLERYAQVMDSYIFGLQELQARGGDVSAVASVASFFVSRFDTEVDRRLNEIGTQPALALTGKTAVANAQVAYGQYLERFGRDDFAPLESAGARRQKPLWASTSTKNPEYPDLLYVEQLVAPNCVNTMPLPTIAAYQDHGDPQPTTIDGDTITAAHGVLDDMAEAGVSYADVVAVLEREGVDKFVASWNELVEAVENA